MGILHKRLSDWVLYLFLYRLSKLTLAIIIFNVFSENLSYLQIGIAAKREMFVKTFSFWLHSFLLWGKMQTVWKFSLVCALALYMLNQSKLYLGMHICLYICLWLYRNNHHCGKYKFQWRCKAETTAYPFLFWLQQFMDEPSNDILRMRGR